MPDGRYAASSPSVSDTTFDDESEGCRCGAGIGICPLVMGASRSLRSGGWVAGLFKAGGGDFKRGDTGQRGEPPEISTVKADFCGCGVRNTVSDDEGGGNVGVVAADICCRGADVGPFDLDRGGLGSCVLFFLDLLVDIRLALPLLGKCLVGEGSLEPKGEAVSEVALDVHREVWVSTFALELPDIP